MLYLKKDVEIKKSGITCNCHVVDQLYAGLIEGIMSIRVLSFKDYEAFHADKDFAMELNLYLSGSDYDKYYSDSALLGHTPLDKTIEYLLTLPQFIGAQIIRGVE